MMESDQKDHMVVLVHGMHGGESDLAHFKKVLNKSHPDKLIIHCAKSNDGWLKTHEGIDVQGKRLADEIIELKEKNPNVRYFSVVGHSLGGLVSRACIGNLLERKFFDQVRPLNYVSLASPHVGSRRPVKGLFNPLASWYTKLFYSRTGKQLMLEDDENGQQPYLVELTDPSCNYYKALSRFESRSAYANVSGDYIVPYSTASISPKNPYLKGERKLVYHPEYPHIIEDEQDQSMAITTADVEENTIFASDQRKEHLRQILKNLRSVPWKRIGVCYDQLGVMKYVSHTQIASKKSWMTQNDVVLRHIADHFVLNPKYNLQTQEQSNLSSVEAATPMLLCQ